MSEDYTTLEAVKRSAFKSGLKDDWLQQDKITFASRAIDQLIAVPAGYFRQATEKTETLTYEGDGTQYLSVRPFLAGSVSDVRFADYCPHDLPPEWREDGRDAARPYLIAKRGCWEFGEAYEVTARWGLPEVPADIEGICIELVVAAWRQKDAAYLRVVAEVNNTTTGAISGQALPERVRLITASWKAKMLPGVL